MVQCTQKYIFNAYCFSLFITPGAIYNGYYYSLIPYPLTYEAAVTYCALSGGYLATISTAAMNTAIVSMFGSSSTYWIGYERATLPCGPWVWQDGSTPNYTNWGTAQPDCNMNNEACTGINFRGAGYWNDFDCTWTMKGICSINGIIFFENILSYLILFLSV